MDTPDEHRLNGEYNNSPLHRYRVAASKNYQHICPPGNVLHISNIPPDSNEQELHDLFLPFSSTGQVLVSFFQPARKMALVQLPTGADAVSGLIFVHNYSLRGQSLRVSFTNRKIA